MEIITTKNRNKFFNGRFRIFYFNYQEKLDKIKDEILFYFARKYKVYYIYILS